MNGVLQREQAKQAWIGQRTASTKIDNRSPQRDDHKEVDARELLLVLCVLVQHLQRRLHQRRDLEQVATQEQAE
jgi:hypothetical protein